MPNLKKLKKIAITSAIAGPSALGLGMSAQAITFGTTQPTDPFSIEVGGSFLTDNNSQKATSNTGFHVGLDYDFEKPPTTGTSTPSIDLDYDDNAGHGNYLYTYGAYLVDRIKFDQNSGSSFHPYVGAGIGLAYIQGRSTSSTTTGTGSSAVTTVSHSSHTATNFAGKLLAGIDFGQAYVEVSYAINGSDKGANDDFIDASVGVHF